MLIKIFNAEMQREKKKEKKKNRITKICGTFAKGVTYT